MRRHDVPPTRVRVGPSRSFAASFAPVAGALCVLACGGEPPAPEAEIRALFARAETALEAKDVKPVKEMISESYADPRGRDKQALKGVLAGHLLGHRVVYLLTRVTGLEILDARRARATIAVGMSGVPVESPEALVTVTGRIYEVELELVREGDAWRLVSAHERPAGLEVFASGG